MLSSGCTRTGTPAAAISPAISHPSAAPARISFSWNSFARRSAVSMSLRRSAFAISGSRPCSTGSNASRSGAAAASGCIWARLKSALRRSYSSASRNNRRSRAETPARDPPASSLAASERLATRPTGDLTSICSMVAPSRSISTAWPLIRCPAGAARAVVIPSMRVTGISTDAGLSPSATLNEAATLSVARLPSRVPATAPISTSPICPPPSISPGVTHLPAASMRVASDGTTTLVPTAAILPSRISTVALAILGPDTGYTAPPVTAIVCARRTAIIGRCQPPAPARARSRCGAGAPDRYGRTRASPRCRPGRLRVDGERVARPDDHVGHLAGLERADDRVESERPRGIDRDPAQRLIERDGYPGPLTRVHRLRRLLVQALDPAGTIGMNQGPPTGLLVERRVLLDPVHRLFLEPPPVGPHRHRGPFLREQVRDLVRLDRVVEGPDLEAELVRQIDHLGHFVGAIAVVLNVDIAAQHLGERLEPQVTLRGIALLVLVPAVPLPAVRLSLAEGTAVARHVAHPGGGAAAPPVHALRVLSARHLQAVARPGELHLLHGPRRDELEDRAAAADQVRRAGQRLDRGDAAGDGQRDLRVLGPERVLGPDLRRDGVRRLVAVRFRIGAGRGVHAEVRMVVDQAGRDVLPGPVHHHCAGRRVHLLPDRDDPPVLEHDRPVSDLLTRGRHDGRVPDQHRWIGVAAIGRRVLRSVDAGALRGGLRHRRRGASGWIRCLGTACAPRGAADPQGDQQIHGVTHHVPPLGGYFTSSTTSRWPTYSVFTTRRGAVPLTYITNGTRDPVTAMWYAWNVPAGTTTFSCAPTLNVSSFTVPSLGEKKFTAKLFPGSSGNAGTEKATASSSIVPGASTVSMSNGLVVPSGCGVALRPFTLPPV